VSSERGGIGAALVLIAVTAGCAGHFAPCPAAGGPAWTEVQGAHFRLRTDADAAAARAALDDLEQFQAALLTVFGAPASYDTGRLPVVMVDRGWTDFAPRRVDGYFTRALFQPLIVMGTGSALARQEVIKHELVHYFSHMVMPRQPTWLSEGLATYYQTIEYDADDGRITVGRPPADLLRVAQQLGPSRFASVFAIEQITDDTGYFYAAAWITVHYLMNHRVEALAGYEKALHEGATPEAAWKAAFGGQTPEALGADVRRYVDGGRYALLRYRFTAPKLAAPAERLLSDAETHATRALLYLTGAKIIEHVPDLAPEFGSPPDEAKRELAEALRQEPDHVAARAIEHFMLKVPIVLEQATAISRKHEDDWLAWLMVADAAGGSAGATTPQDNALERALDIASRDRSIRIPVETK
jgi:tetratricopeptide (TPR) repeat protein